MGIPAGPVYPNRARPDPDDLCQTCGQPLGEHSRSDACPEPKEGGETCPDPA